MEGDRAKIQSIALAAETSGRNVVLCSTAQLCRGTRSQGELEFALVAMSNREQKRI